MLKINGSTGVVAVIGDPIAHSASPRMHNAAFAHLGLDMVYIPLHIPTGGLKSALDMCRIGAIKGLNVTVPHKTSVLPLLDYVDPLAKAAGSVNTIVYEKGTLCGYTTDGQGFMMALTEEGGITLENKRIVIIGAGGSARAIASAFSREDVSQLDIINRSRGRGEQLYQDIHSLMSIPFRFYTSSDSASTDILRQADIVVNTTSVGMAPTIDAIPLPTMEWVRPNQLVCDIIYRPEYTQFLTLAAAAGARTMGGAGMLAGQGMLAFTYFTGHSISYTIMRNEV